MPPPFPDLDTIISETKDISPAPQILPKLRRILDDPDSELHEAVALMKMDVALSGRILKYANSSLFRVGDPVDSLDYAVQRFGFRQVQKLVLLASAKSALSRKLALFETGGYSLFEISLSCGEIMSSLASGEGFLDQEVAYTVGLFQGIGKIVVDDYFSRSGLVFYGNGNEFKSREEQRKFLGFDHAQAGAALLKKWRFSESVWTPIEEQFAPLVELTEHRASTLALNFSVFAAIEILEPPFEPELIIESYRDQYPDFWEESGFSEERTKAMLLQAQEAYQNNVQITR